MWRNGDWVRVDPSPLKKLYIIFKPWSKQIIPWCGYDLILWSGDIKSWRGRVMLACDDVVGG